MFELRWSLRSEGIGEQFRDHRQVAYLLAAQAEAACDVFERRPAEHGQAVVDAVAYGLRADYPRN